MSNVEIKEVLVSRTDLQNRSRSDFLIAIIESEVLTLCRIANFVLPVMHFYLFCQRIRNASDM